MQVEQTGDEIVCYQTSKELFSPTVTVTVSVTVTVTLTLTLTLTLAPLTAGPFGAHEARRQESPLLFVAQSAGQHPDSSGAPTSPYRVEGVTVLTTVLTVLSVCWVGRRQLSPLTTPVSQRWSLRSSSMMVLCLPSL